MSAHAGIVLLQHASKDAGVTSSSSLTFPANNTAGNWIGVVIRAGHSGQTLTVSDTTGNTYRPAFQFNQTLDGPNGETLAIYYAENITGGANIVTVTESLAKNTLRFAIFEYSGIATTNSLDVTAAGQSSGTTFTSGNATTTVGGDLILGEVTSADGVTFTAGSGYAIEERVPAAPNTKLIVEDAVQLTAGTISVSATVSISNNGGAVLAAFKAASGTLSPSITSLTPPSGPVGSSVTIAGANFGASQGTSTITFNGTVAAPTSWSATSIVVPVPSGATTGNVVVTVGGVASNGVNFTVLPTPSITGLSPSSGPVGMWLLINGTNFGTTVGTVTFNGVPATSGIGWSSTSIQVAVPVGATTGNVIVTAGGVPSNGFLFTVTPAPVITSISPNSGAYGTSVTVSGTGFGFTQGSGTASFNGTVVTPTNWFLSTITFKIPTGATSGNVVVTVGGQPSNGVAFTVLPISVSLAPTTANVIVNTGIGLSATVQNDVQTQGVTWSLAGAGCSGPTCGTLASPSSPYTIGYIAPSSVPNPPIVTVTATSIVDPTKSATSTITVAPAAPSITSINPIAGPINTLVTISGANLGSAQGLSTVTFNGVAATTVTSWSNTGITAAVPASATTGNVVVTVGGTASNGIAFTVTPSSPNIASLTPASGQVGALVTIAGAGFSSIQGGSSVTFNGIGTNPTSWSDTSLIAPVPPGATSGSVVVTIGSVASNGVNFSVTPNIASISPVAGGVGTPITITGSGFGSAQGTSNVTFNGTAATPTAWSATSITVPVPAGAATGNIVVTIGGVASNGVNFTVTTTAANIALVQHASKDAGVTSSSALAFPSNNTAGNWLGVVIRAGHSGQTLTVSDTHGNTYRQAVQSNETLDAPNGETFAIYYAENISGGANTVTVSQSITNNTLRFAILEYSGVATSNSLDVIAAAQGTGTTPNSGNATTTAGGDLVLGMVVTANGATMTAGSGFTIEERVPAAPNTKLVAEDEIKAGVGAVAANATLTASDNWGAGFAAFKAAAGGGGAGPNISNLNPTSGPVGTPVTITGTNFGASQGTSTITFNGTVATPTSWTATSIGVPVPTGATSGNVVVTVGGVASNSVAFNINSSAPSITNLNPTSGPVGTPVTITGTNFGASQGSSTVTFNGTTASPTSWTATSIGVPVPAGATTGNVVVTVGGVASSGVNFSVTSTAPFISSLNPVSGTVATPVTITGTNFGSSQGTSTVTFNGTPASPTSWNTTTIVVPVPTSATSGNVVVTVGGVASNGANFTVTAPATNGIALVQHTGKDAGVVTSASSLAFSSANTAGNFIAVVIRGGKAFQIFTVSDSRGNTYHQAIQANLTVDGESDAIYYAESITGGANTVTVAESITNNTLRFAILEYSGVAPSNSLDVTASSQGTDTSPSSGNATTTGVGELLIAEISNANGTTFGAGSGLTLEESVPAAPGSKLLVEDGIQPLPGLVSGTASMAAFDNWGAALAAFRPASAGPGPHIVSVSPRTAPVGAQVTIAGTNFGSTQGASTVTFNGTPATSKTWSATSIVVTVPSGATSGNVVVTVGGTASNGSNFTVGFAPPFSFVQAGSNQNIDAPLPTAQNFITVPFKGAQTTGNMNVVVVGWQDSSATVASVTDSVGNVYRLANNTVVSGTASLSTYYASDILPSPPNTNVVAVAFNGLATNGDVRIAEYAGLDPTNPLDVAVSGQGSSGVSNSNSVSTTNANDLLVGANVVFAKSTAAGAGYTNRVISLNGGILEDRIVSATGSYSATAALSGGGNWIMQMVAFKAPAAAAPGITIAVSPLAVNTATGFGTQTFTATLQNDVQRLGVTWTLSGSGCSGITCGLLSNITATSATYTAPANLPSPATVTLTATSVADTTKAAGATINVTQGALNVAIGPKRAAVTLTQVQQFNATVTNDPPNAGVVWSVDGNNGGNATVGTISSTGLFTPGTQAGVHTVTASSVSNASVNVSATVAVTDLAGVFTYHYDSQSTGQNTKEYALTTSTVTPSTFGLLFNCPVDGFMFAIPLYAANLTIGGQTHNVVFLATEHNSVYAFDADSSSCVQFWKTSFLSNGVTTVPPADTGDGVSLVVEFGITGTPVIDPATNTLYVVANTKETVGTGCSQASPCYFYRLHALDLLTGAEKFGGPVLVAAPNFNPLAHLQRPALLLNNGIVYVAFGSHADLNTYQGWVMAYNASTLAQIYAWPSTVPTGGNNQGAIWGSGNPPVADASGNVYVVTGNGVWDGTQNFSDSLVRLSPTGGVPPDYFTPFDQSAFNLNDIDLGSSGAMILPDAVGSVAHPHVMIVTGKVGVIYLLDQTNLGKFHNGSNQDLGEVVLGFNLTSGDNGFYGQPAYWNGNLYATIVADFLRQFPISNATIASTASSVAPKLYPYRGATPSVSANGNANGIVWIEDANPYLFNGPSILDAYDASRVATQIYTSPMTGAGAACSASKFIVPVVANGKVYISGSNCFSVFGLLPN
ncbi:MAG TPA: IPT/TIG domain-containing protein [Candidatus Acidoferrum sp.]|nr:IPT/TIG domain-containing protein [Candidatus Acidoferrum sp.]